MITACVQSGPVLTATSHHLTAQQQPIVSLGLHQPPTGRCLDFSGSTAYNEIKYTTLLPAAIQRSHFGIKKGIVIANSVEIILDIIINTNFIFSSLSSHPIKFESLGIRTIQFSFLPSQSFE